MKKKKTKCNNSIFLRYCMFLQVLPMTSKQWYVKREYYFIKLNVLKCIRGKGHFILTNHTLKDLNDMFLYKILLHCTLF